MASRSAEGVPGQQGQPIHPTAMTAIPTGASPAAAGMNLGGAVAAGGLQRVPMQPAPTTTTAAAAAPVLLLCCQLDHSHSRRTQGRPLRWPRRSLLGRLAAVSSSSSSSSSGSSSGSSSASRKCK
ncbi:hypothetical protein CAOG_009898 [Capsaspora owczarzaki ATCC 30864]|uniref:Uncharacterized protein n=1 Tax=Capsaspora owczarzaki (strain ATCC 30864) TaxID=595528 RepID=A0A0D2UJI2_CAPO3|nr:hypothetical protein CAOG_009898 [Capsaspora owczarzaki ATCC 30864]